MNKALQIILLFSTLNEDFTSSSDNDKARNSKRSRASKMGWKKFRHKYETGMNRAVRLKSMFSGKKSFLLQLRNRIKKVKNQIKRQKMKELHRQQMEDKKKLNLVDNFD